MKMYLMREGLMTIVDGTEQEPAEGATVAVKTAYDARKNKALADIVLSISPNQLYIIGEPSDPTVVWTTLREVFRNNTLLLVTD